eukprot:5390090-Prymnesium_polylepis.2
MTLPGCDGEYDVSGFVIGLITEERHFTFSDGNVLWFILLSIVGGCLGALYNICSRAINTWRRNWIARHPGTFHRRRLLEVMLLSAAAYSVIFWLPVAFDCTSCPSDSGCGSHRRLADAYGGTIGRALGENGLSHLIFLQFHCEEGYFSEMATLLQADQFSVLKHLYLRTEIDASLDGSSGTMSIPVLGTMLVVYFTLGVVLFGMALPCGNLCAAGQRSLRLAPSRPQSWRPDDAPDTLCPLPRATASQG